MNNIRINKMKKFVVLFITLALIITCMPMNLLSAYGETVYSYNVEKAVAYAKAHYNDESTTTTEGQDCTQFVRECFEAGGVPTDSNRVNESGPYGYTVDGYVAYLTENGYAVTGSIQTEKMNLQPPQWYVNSKDNTDLSVGDGVVYYCKKCGTQFHMSIVTGVNEDGYFLYHAQNSAVGGESLCLIDCSNCGASRDNVILSSLHITSKDNGYSNKYDNTTASDVRVERLSNSELKVTWDAVDGAAGYKVFIKNGVNSAYNPYGDVKTNEFQWTESTPGASYYFAVRPYFEDGGKVYVGALSEFAYNNEYLAKPQNLKITYDNSTGVAKLTWDAVPGADKYEVYRATSMNGDYTLVFSPEGPSFTTSNFSAGGTYYFKVKAINADNPAGNSSFSDIVAITAGGLTSPVVTTSVTEKGEIRLDWDYVQGANGYRVYRATSENGTFTELTKSAQTGNGFTNSSVTAGQVYYYKVRAISNNGSYAESPIVSQMAPMQKPVVKITTDKKGKPVLSWSSVKGADRYLVYRDTKQDGGFTASPYKVNGTTFTNTSTVIGTTYYYKVEAVSDKYNNANSMSSIVSVMCTEPDKTIEVERYSGPNRYETAFSVADELKQLQGVDEFSNVIVAYGNDYADALGGSYLAKVKNAPILVINSRVESYVLDYINENVKAGGTVYLLGGEGVVSKAFEDSLKGYDVVRLGGANRYETNMNILREAGVSSGDEVLVCSATSFADSLSASAVGKPILLVNKSLYQEQIDLLEELGCDSFYLIGGTGAVTDTVKGQLDKIGNVERVAGVNRYETSMAIAKKFFADGSSTVVIASGNDYPDGLTGGPLAMALDAPLFLVNDKNTNYAAEYAQTADVDTVTVVGGTGAVSETAVKNITG